LALTANKIVNLGTIDTRIGFQATTHHQSPVVDMSGTANSYIVTPNSSFQFNATVKGHTNELIGGDPNKAIVIWESFGTTTKPNVGDIIKSASYSQGIVTVETGESGNALVAIIDRDETILWSWHIWVTDYNPALDCDEYANNAGYVMDRNLGALSATPGDVRANGLLYEWGRKDPFMSGGSLTDNNVPAAATIDFPSSITSDEFKGTIEYATQNPTQFIVFHYAYHASYSNYDWYYGYYVYENTRWNSSKGTYDPCPAGWRVPNGGDSGLWAKAGIPKSNEGDAINKGVWVSRAYCGADTWYPAPGLIISRDDHSCQLQDVGVRGEYYACTHNNIDLFRVGSMSLSIGGGFSSNRQDSFKANGFSIRCVADKQ
jgi:hypothetical protein